MEEPNVSLLFNHLPALVRSISEKISADCTVRDSASELLQSLRADIRTTEVYFVRKEEDAEVAARRIQIRITGRQGQ